MKLRNLPDNESDEYANIEIQVTKENGEKIFEEQRIELSKISKTIDDETIKRCGTDKSIMVDDKLQVTVYKKNQLNLTIIDLPGITENPREGQPENIGEIIKNMYLDYIKPKETIILNVVDIRQDLSRSTSLKLSSEVDPKCKRTIICYTHGKSI